MPLLPGIEDAIGAFFNHLEVANDISSETVQVPDGLADQLRDIGYKYVYTFKPPPKVFDLDTVVRMKATVMHGGMEIRSGMQGRVIEINHDDNRLVVLFDRRVRGAELWGNQVYFDIVPGGQHGIDLSALEEVK